MHYLIITNVTIYSVQSITVTFGSKLHLRYIAIPVHEVVRGLDPSMCKTLPISMHLLVVQKDSLECVESIS